MQNAKRRNKFNAQKTEINGVVFHSKKEAKRISELWLLEKAGQIRELQLQPRFELVVNGVKICTYIGDAAYFEGNKRVIEDVKSKGTKTPVYRLKKKLLLAIHPGLNFRET